MDMHDHKAHDIVFTHVPENTPTVGKTRCDLVDAIATAIREAASFAAWDGWECSRRVERLMGSDQWEYANKQQKEFVDKYGSQPSKEESSPVTRLPITKDGVLLLGGQFCFSAEARSDPFGEQDNVVARQPCGLDGRKRWHLAQYHGMGSGIPSFRPVSECYSTREMAKQNLS